MAKKAYRVRNWRKYNKSLEQRGNITLWFNKESLRQWQYSGKRDPGGVQRYSDGAIKTALLVKEVFCLSYRACRGFIQSLCHLVGYPDQPIISWSQLSRRAKEAKDFLKLHTSKNVKHVAIDSTGIKAYGTGEWLRKKFDKDKQSAWLKLHIAIDTDRHEILSMDMSDGRCPDSDYFETVIDKASSDIEKIYGDGAYDKWKCYRKANSMGAVLITPPQRTACLQKNNRNHAPEKALKCRDRAIRFMRSHEDHEIGRKKWKEMVGYHKRSLVETNMFRLKSIFGDVVRNRNRENQYAQLLVRCYALNKLTNLGMPKSESIC
jgi:hypothetical protein